MMEIATSAYGDKSHLGADRWYRFIRTWTVTDASRHDRRELGRLLDRTDTASFVWADTACRSQKNGKKIAKAGLVSKVHFRKPPGKPMPEAKKRANSARSRSRSCVEHVVADQKHHMHVFIRTIRIARAKNRIGIADIAHNMRRLLFRGHTPKPQRCQKSVIGRAGLRKIRQTRQIGPQT